MPVDFCRFWGLAGHDSEVMSDWQLLSAYNQGDEGAFESLVQKRLPMVYSAAVQHVGDPHLAEEIAQSVFILPIRWGDGEQPPFDWIGAGFQPAGSGGILPQVSGTIRQSNTRPTRSLAPEAIEAGRGQNRGRVGSVGDGTRNVEPGAGGTQGLLQGKAGGIP